MSHSGQDRVTVRVEVVVEGGRTSSIQTQSGEERLLPFGNITFPQPCPPSDTPIVRQSSGVNYIEAWGDSPTISGKLPRKVWALAYSVTGVSTSMHPAPETGAVSTTPTANGHWSFLQADNNPVPGAACEGTPCSSVGRNNSTLLVWWDYGTPSSPNYAVVESTGFHGYCPGSSGAGMATAGAVAVGSFHLPTTLHAAFTGALAKLGTVALTWNGVSWVGESSAGGGCVLSLLGHGSAFQLLAAGPGTAFIVAGLPKSCQRFHWSAEGAAWGTLAGPFAVTVLE